MRKMQLPDTSPNEKGLSANYKTLSVLFAMLLSLSAMAQGEQSSPGLMRSHLKIYVVVTVLLIIFLGIVIFLLSLDRRLKKLEEL